MSDLDIKKIRKELGLSQKEFAEKLGVHSRTVQNWEAGREIPNSKRAKLRDLEEILKDSPIKLNILEEERAPYGKEGYRENGNRGVPYYDIDITATITQSFSDVREDPEFYVDFRPFNDCSAYLPIWGDSMFPTYTAGDIVAVKKLNNPNVIQWGEAHLIITGPQANNMKTVKLLFPHQDESKIVLRASNPNFAGDTVINKEDICSIYIVKGKITRKQL